MTMRQWWDRVTGRQALLVQVECLQRVVTRETLAHCKARQMVLELYDRIGTLEEDLQAERELFVWAQGTDKLSLRRENERLRLSQTNAEVRERALQLKLERLMTKVMEG